MPIPSIEQPDCLEITPSLRLRRYNGEFAFALPWYQDPETVRLVDGRAEPYDLARLERMYTYLDIHGELYFIEYRCAGEAFEPVGDVTFWREDMPIVIGDKALRGRGIGRRVVARLIERGRALGYDTLFVNEIYDFNTGSRRCFESQGFFPYEATEQGHRYRLDLRQNPKEEHKSCIKSFCSTWTAP